MRPATKTRMDYSAEDTDRGGIDIKIVAGWERSSQPTAQNVPQLWKSIGTLQIDRIMDPSLATARMNSLQISGRIVTPTGRAGVIATPPYRLNLYAFVHFDDGAKLFMLRSILRAEPIVPSSKSLRLFLSHKSRSRKPSILVLPPPDR